MRVIVSQIKCIASGSCSMICPEVFGPRKSDGVVHVLNEHPALHLIAQIQKAADMCPASVFTIEDEQNTSELVIVEESDE